MSGSSSSFARTARALSLIAVSMMAATMPTPLLAESSKERLEAALKRVPPQCKSAGNALAQLNCGSAYYQDMKRKSEAQSAAAKAEIANANASSQCIDRVMREAGDPKLLSSEQKARYRAKVLACG